MTRPVGVVSVGWIALLSACTPMVERLDAYLHEREAAGFSGAIAVYQDGAVVFADGYGFANRERQIPNGAETVFPFGSNVKDFTRALIIELEVQGRLRRDQTLSDFFRDVPSDKAGITVEQLMRHTAGLHPYHGERLPAVPADHVEMSEETARDLIFGQELLFSPGERFSYSNSGYTLLAMIIERVSSMRYPNFVATHFTEPAGMENSGFYADQRWTPDDVAVGYGRVTYGVENSPYYWPVNAWPVAGNGGMAGPVVDLLAAVQYIAERRRESEAFDRAWRETSPEDQPADVYGGAGGNDFGFVSVVFYWPARDIGLVLASNNDDDGAEDQQMLADLLRIAFDLGLGDLGGTDDQAGDARVDLTGVDDLPTPSGDWGVPDRGTWRRVGLVFDALADADTSALAALVDEMFTPRFRSSVSRDEHLRQLIAIRAALLPIALAGAEMENQVRFMLTMRGTDGVDRVLTIELERAAPFRVDGIQLESGSSAR